MRIVNTLCISKEKAVRHYVGLIVKVFKENPKIAQGGRVLSANYRRAEWDVLRPNWMFIDRREEGVGWGKESGEDVINFIFLLFNIFFSLFTLCAFHSFFIVFHVKQKR